MKPPSPWETEADLCAAFAALATAEGWTVYPECGWDMLLVRDGVQIGVEAKLRANLEVVRQAVDGLSRCWGEPGKASEGPAGPDFIAVLTPHQDGALTRVCWACGVTALSIHTQDAYDAGFRRRGVKSSISPRLPLAGLDDPYAWTPHYFDRPCWTPPYVPDLPAGVPSPRSLTRWKVEAVRLCVLLRQRGYLTTADIRAAQISPAYFTQHLLQPDGKIGKHFRYVPRPGVKMPDEDHPEVAAAMVAEGVTDAAPGDQPALFAKGEAS